MSQSYTKNQPLDTDATLAANSDNVASSQKAVKTYIANSAETATSLGVVIGNSGDATPNDTDYVATALTGGGILNKITWTNVKAFLKTYFDTLYVSKSTMSGGRYWLIFATYVDLLPITATGKFPHLAGIDRNMTLQSWVQPCRVITTSDSSNYWTIQLTKSDGSSIATVTTATVNTTDWKNITASFSPISLTASTTPVLYTVSLTKTGTPGALYLGAPVCEVSIS